MCEKILFNYCARFLKNRNFINIRDHMGDSMTSSRGQGKLKSGIIGLGIMLVLVLLVSGCTQQAATPAGTTNSNGHSDVSWHGEPGIGCLWPGRWDSRD